MTRNQKIALGCGGAGCLGLIVVVIAACLLYLFFYPRTVRVTRAYPSNVNRNTNSNSNLDSNSNSSTSDSSLSDDDKHRLFHAARVTGDAELVRRVNAKLGLLDEDFTQGDKYQEFAIEHVSWSIQNTDFIQSINTPEKARAYVNDHFPE